MITVPLETLTPIVVIIATLGGQIWLVTRHLTRRIDRLEDRMEARFAGVDARFTSVDARFDAMDARFERKFEQMNQQMFALAAGLRPLVEQARRAETG